MKWENNHKEKIAYQSSSGNVFADLGIENPDEALAKSELVIHPYRQQDNVNIAY